MKAKRLCLLLTMFVFCIGSVVAQEKKVVRELFDENGVLNQSILTEEELKWALFDEASLAKLTAKERAEVKRSIILALDNDYIGEDGLMYTKLTREDVLKQGFPEFVYELMQSELKLMREHHQKYIDEYGQQAIDALTKANKEANERYAKEGRPKMVAEMNAALKQAETEEAAEKAK